MKKKGLEVRFTTSTKDEPVGIYSIVFPVIALVLLIISLATGWERVGSHISIFSFSCLGLAASFQGIKRGDDKAYIGLGIAILALIIEIIRIAIQSN